MQPEAPDPAPVGEADEAERLSAVNIAFVAAYHEAAVTLRIALGSVRSLKLPDWLSAQVEAAWEETRELMDPLDLDHHSVLSSAARPAPSASGSDTDDWLASGAVRVFEAAPSGDRDEI